MSRWGNYPLTEEYKEKVKGVDAFCLSLSQTSWLSFDHVKNLYYECKEDRELTKQMFEYWSRTGYNPIEMMSLAGRQAAAAVLKLNEAIMALGRAGEETTAKMRRIVEVYNLPKPGQRFRKT